MLILIVVMNIPETRSTVKIFVFVAFMCHIPTSCFNDEKLLFSISLFRLVNFHARIRNIEANCHALIIFALAAARKVFSCMTSSCETTNRSVAPLTNGTRSRLS